MEKRAKLTNGETVKTKMEIFQADFEISGKIHILQCATKLLCSFLLSSLKS